MACISYDVYDGKKRYAVRSSIWACDPSKAYEQKEFLKIITYALSELPGRLAQVFILREIFEFSSQEICDLLDISVCNLYVMIHRLLSSLLLITLMVFLSNVLSEGENPNLAGAEFLVS